MRLSRATRQIRTPRAILRLATPMIALLAMGCSGNVTAPSSKVVPQTPGGQTFSISGTVSPAAGGSSATVSLSGAATATTNTNTSGAYSFSGLSAGTYAVTPSNTGYSFNPTTLAAIITSANITGMNFVASPQTGQTFSISGTISPASSGTGVGVVLSGPVGATATTNSSGNYTFTGLPNGTYVVTPNKSGISFTPASLTETINGANQSGANFTATSGSQSTHTVTLNWTASTSTVSGYNVYRSTVNGSGYVKLNSVLVNAATYLDSNVTDGITYFYVATAVDSGGTESADSNQATAVIP
jgi:hypothetical protein